MQLSIYTRLQKLESQNRNIANENFELLRSNIARGERAILMAEANRCLRDANLLREMLHQYQ